MAWENVHFVSLLCFQFPQKNISMPAGIVSFVLYARGKQIFCLKAVFNSVLEDVSIYKHRFTSALEGVIKETFLRLQPQGLFSTPIAGGPTHLSTALVGLSQSEIC